MTYLNRAHNRVFISPLSFPLFVDETPSRKIRTPRPLHSCVTLIQPQDRAELAPPAGPASPTIFQSVVPFRFLGYTNSFPQTPFEKFFCIYVHSTPPRARLGLSLRKTKTLVQLNPSPIASSGLCRRNPYEQTHIFLANFFTLANICHS